MKSFEITVFGQLQGIGYRTFIADYAEEHGIKGAVRNSGGAVKLHVVINPDDMSKLSYHLRYNCPANGRVENIIVRPLEKSLPAEDFRIIKSDDFDEGARFLPPDIGICPDCMREVLDPADRRYRYPFISCNVCGPRYSVMKRAPYDRINLTFDDFPMCQECIDDYREKGNRHRHAETIGCKNCGPKLSLYLEKNQPMDDLSQDEMLDKTIELLKSGKIGAVRNVGGFHFMSLPESEPAKRIRVIKERETKPLAVLFPDIKTIRKYCVVTVEEEERLLSSARPIVLLKKKKSGKVLPYEISGESDRLGAILPCNGLQVILTNAVGPLLITSGNKGNESTIIKTDEMMEFMKDDNTEEQECIDFMLTNNIEILTPLEDSVVQYVDKKYCGHTNGSIFQILRRSRGYVPENIVLDKSVNKDTYAAGGDLRSSYAMAKDNTVLMSEDFGDLTYESSRLSRKRSMTRINEMINVHPERFLADMHPDFISSADTLTMSEDVSYIQHHRAHVLAVIAEEKLKGKVLGIAFGFGGYGDDDTIWGSEIFSCNIPKAPRRSDEEIDYRNSFSMKRTASLTPVKLMSGSENVKDAMSTLCCYLRAIEERQLISSGELKEIMNRLGINSEDYGVVCACLKADISSYRSSSMGRLFDAVAALMGIRRINTYEGECANMLENYAIRYADRIDEDKADDYGEPLALKILEPRNDDEIYRMDQTLLMADAIHKYIKLTEKEDIQAEEVERIRERIAFEIHMAVVNTTTELADEICSRDYINHVVLCGSIMNDRILVSRLNSALTELGYIIHFSSHVPGGDGGLALGQVYGSILNPEPPKEPENP